MRITMSASLAIFLTVWCWTAFAQDPAPAPAPPADAAAAPAPAPAEPAPAPPAEPAPPPPPPPPPSIRQVQIQVWISETTEQGLRDIGNNLNYTRITRGVEQSGSVERVRTQVFDARNPSYGVVLPAPDTNPFPDNLRPDLSGTRADGIQTQAGAGVTYEIVDNGRGTIDGVFRAIEEKSDVDLISKPEILVINDTAAEIHAGSEVPYQSVGFLPTGQANLKVAWQKVGVDMKLTPHTPTDDLVQIDLTELKVSDVVRYDKVRGLDLPVVSERSQAGSVLVPNGQTLVIGGLSSRIVRKNERRVPVVGRLPVIGLPFRGRKSDASNSHLLIFVSPTIVDLRDLRPESISALNFWQEEQWKNKKAVEQEIRIMEEEL